MKVVGLTINLLIIGYFDTLLNQSLKLCTCIVALLAIFLKLEILT